MRNYCWKVGRKWSGEGQFGMGGIRGKVGTGNGNLHIDGYW